MRINTHSVGKLLPGMMLLILAVAPTQWSLPLPVDVSVTLADLLLLASVPLGLCAGLRIRRQPLAHLLFLGLVAFSAFFASDGREALKEWIQLALYFGAGTLLAEAALRQAGVRGLRVAVGVFLAVGALIVGLALVQYCWEPMDQPLRVRGTFGNRNVLGGYLTLLLPIAFGVFLQTKSLWLRLALAALVLVGLVVCLSGAALLAIAIVLLILAARRGAGWLMVTGIVLMVGFTVVAPRLPRYNDYEAFKSVALYDDATGEPMRRYPEWQAATVMALERPWVGMGPGSYQKQIGPFYGVVPNATGPAEPDIQNLYLVLASTAGLPACLAFIMMLWGGILDAVTHRPGAEAAARSVPGLSAGMAAALGAFALTAVWHPLLVRGIGLPLALILATIHSQKINPDLKGNS